MKRVLADFEEYLSKNLPIAKSFHPYFEKATGEMLKAGGKRFRPLLLLSVVDSYEPMLVENAYAAALAVEFIHTYSLIHDDLPTFDDADLRRGHPTLHVTYDEVTAILAGDGLNTHAFYLLSNAPLSSDIKCSLISELAQNGGIGGMVLGQAIDCFFEKKKLSLQELKFLHIHKTAKLIAASLKMGAIIAGLSKDKQSILYDFGIKLGLLFQIQDDIIDATKSSLEAGKTTNNDKEKNSFVNLLSVDGAKEEKKRLLEELKGDLLKIDNQRLTDRLNEILIKYFE